MLLPVGCPLLITAGHCAKFGYEGLEDLTDLQAVKPPSELHHRLHLLYLVRFLKPAKVANHDENPIKKAQVAKLRPYFQ